jgi:transcriptional regulator GlxA family with amidase domain
MKYAILIYDGVEPIDLGATFGVLSMAKRVDASIETFGVANRAGPLTCAGGLRVHADYGFDTCPVFDALIVTGGPGWPQAASDPQTLSFLKTLPENALISSICTGAMILAAAGLLQNRSATTKVEVIGEERSPLNVLVSLGIDGVLYLIRHLHGVGVAAETARILEYERALKANAAALPPIGHPLIAGIAPQ